MDAGSISNNQIGSQYQVDMASRNLEKEEKPQDTHNDQLRISGKSEKTEIYEGGCPPNCPYEEHVPSELIVRFKSGMPRNMEIKNIKLKLITKFDLKGSTINEHKGDLCHVRIESGQSVEEAIGDLMKDQRIDYVEPNYILRIPEGETDEPEMRLQASQGTPAVPQNKPNDLDGQLWGLNNEGQTGGKADADIDAPEAWNIAVGNNGENAPIIAVIDTGVDYTHPELKNNIWTNPGEIPGDGIDNDGNGYIDDVHGYDFCNKDGDPMDDHGHGTHCAGTIGAEGNNEKGVVGVNWKARIMPLKFLSASGSGTTADAISAVIYSTKMGAKISSNSWSGGDYSQALKDAIKGFPGLFVAAAGNAGTNNDSQPRYPSSYDNANIVSVAASDHNDRLAYFSCYGKETVDLAAPGVKVFSTIPGEQYGSKSGTSMATPHVAGAAGLIASNNPELTTDELKERLLANVDPEPEFKDKMVSGGRLNVYNAIKQDAPPPPPPEPPPPEPPPQQPPPGQ